MPDDDTEALESYDGQRDDYGRPDGQGVGTFQQTCVTYSGMWEMGRPAGPGQFTFPGGRHIQLKVERPTAADFCSRSSTLAPGYIWPQEPHENQQGREIDIDGFIYTCSILASGDVCLTMARQKQVAPPQMPHRIVAESLRDGRCRGKGSLVWKAANGASASYEGELQGTAKTLALMHGQVSATHESSLITRGQSDHHSHGASAGRLPVLPPCSGSAPLWKRLLWAPRPGRTAQEMSVPGGPLRERNTREQSDHTRAVGPPSSRGGCGQAPGSAALLWKRPALEAPALGAPRPGRTAQGMPCPGAR